MMNAESTPVKKDFKFYLKDILAEITPVKEQEEIKRFISVKRKGKNIRDIDTEEDSDVEPVAKSQFYKSQKRQKNEDLKESQRKVLASDCGDTESIFGSNSDLLVHTILPNYVRGQEEQIDTKMEFQDSAIDELLLNVKHELQESEKSIVARVESKISSNISTENVEVCDSKSLKKQSSNESVDEMLRVSDVMKWNDDSLISQSKLSFSNQIKKKLLENINNKDIIRSQTSGWTQFNCDNQLNSESFEYHKVISCNGLPSKVQELYEQFKGIKHLYSWQQECLSLEAVKYHKNLVYALPTSGGKTLVAEILILREILWYKKNVLFILPFVSIVQEKIRDFSQFALELGFLVEEYAAGKGVIPPRKRKKKNSLFIATIEKALIIVNSLIEAKRLGEVGLIVVDELHLLSEEGRGAILESLLTQILYVGGELGRPRFSFNFELEENKELEFVPNNKLISISNHLLHNGIPVKARFLVNRDFLVLENIQIIGMTATIGNLKEVAAFLKAESYIGNFRPVHLSEYVKCGNKIFAVNYGAEESLQEVKTLSSSREVDPDGIGLLVQDVVPDESVLIFCPTKKNCENVAILLCKVLSRNLMKNKEKHKMSLYRALVSETNDQICPILKKTIPFGVAYHHSGLTAGERKLLEESFREGTVSVICCTSTLAAGVNLPAKRVIIRSPYVGKDFISLSKYKQMVGRAGRTGLASGGESYLIFQPTESEKVRRLFQSQMDEVTSKLDSESCKNLVLSAIGLGTATTRRTLRELFSYSLHHIQTSKLNKETEKMTDACISRLYKQGALKVKNCQPKGADNSFLTKLELNASQGKKSLKIASDSPLTVSRLGRAAMKGGLSLEKAHELYSDLVKAQAGLVLLTSLHLLYVVTPHDVMQQIKPNFSIFFNVYMQLDSKEVHTAKTIGVTEFVVSKLAIGVKPKNIQESVLHRFYISLILNELWKEQTIWDVAILFQIPRGLVQMLMTSASTFANSVLRFCEELEELWSFKSLLTEFVPRLAHCCSPELLPLMDLPAVKRGRAKQLYDAGFKTLQILAVAQPADLVRSVDHLSCKAASQIVAAAKLMLVEKAENLQEEAENVLEGLATKFAPSDV